MIKAIQTLREKTEGAIMVFGLFASVFLVGGLYYTVSVSHTVLQREGLQQAADTSSYSASVVQSRGMNMISSMNVLISALSAILLPIRAMLPAYQQVIDQQTPLCNPFNPCACQILQDATQAHTRLDGISTSAEQQIGQLFRTLSDAQNTIAKQVPTLAKQSANSAANANGVFLEQKEATLMGPTLAAQGCRLGLPVQEDEFKQACTRAKVYTAQLSNKLADQTLQTMQGACKSGPLALGFAAPHIIQADTEYCKENDQPACSGSGGGGASSAPHPKKVFDQAKNGNDYMASWTKVQGKKFDDGKKGVEVGAFGEKGSDFDNTKNIAFAQSEIYFDCTGKWDTCNKDQQAMWSTQWTARMRRIKQPTISFQNDSEVKQQLTDPKKWKQEREKLLTARKTPWLDGDATTAIAKTLSSSEEGPLQ